MDSSPTRSLYRSFGLPKVPGRDIRTIVSESLMQRQSHHSKSRSETTMLSNTKRGPRSAPEGYMMELFRTGHLPLCSEKWNLASIKSIMALNDQVFK